MSGKFKLIAFLTLGPFVVVLLALGGAGLWLGSDGFRHSLEATLERATGLPVRIERVTFTWAGGLRASGVTLDTSSDEALSRVAVKVQDVSMDIDLWPLLKNRVVIREIVLLQPELTWRANDNGEWRLEQLRKSADRDDPPALAPAPAPTPSAPGNSSLPPNPPAATNEAFPPSLPPAAPAPAPIAEADLPPPVRRGMGGVEVHRIRLEKGEFRFLRRDESSLALLENVNFQADTSDSRHYTGQVSLSQAILFQRLILHNITAPFTLDRDDSDHLILENIVAEVAGGQIRANLDLGLHAPGTPAKAEISAEHVDLPRFAKESGYGLSFTEGEVSGRIRAEGLATRTADLRGDAALTVRNPRFSNNDLLRIIGEAMQIDELAKLQADSLVVNGTFDHDTFNLTDATLLSPNLRIEARGPIQMAKPNDLDLDASLHLSGRQADRIPSFLLSAFHASTTPGYRAMDFKITGDINRPKTNILENLAKPAKEFLGGLLDQFFGKEQPAPKKENP